MTNNSISFYNGRVGDLVTFPACFKAILDPVAERVLRCVSEVLALDFIYAYS